MREQSQPVKPRDPSGGDDPEFQAVVDALDDEACHAIVEELTEPMTASELSEACDIPLSTTYRKLELLTDSSLVAEETQLRKDGRHTSQYRVDFETVSIMLTEDHALTLSIERPPETPEERLASMWKEVRKET
ncbi:helix-turn-helix domain-containing protein [Haloarchaeobius sp. DFWS5]|uniref:helix-turn-helix domain-containing protein n=1 Tax=Haloarchaeobius sp. DFWS5 TaxID=3446114 RepID=UPI003EBD94C7